MTADRSCCVNCEHFYFYPEEPGYSELTPGSSASMGCSKRLWDVEFCDANEHQFRRCMAQSQTCTEFTPREA